MDLRSAAWIVVLATSRCAGSDDARDPGETSEGTAADSDTTSTTSTAVDTTGGADVESSSSSSTGIPLVDVPAQGIAVDFVEINQGVSVRIGEDGQGVPSTARTAPVVANRIALVRGFYTVPDDWQPRDIDGRLVLSHADGTIETLSDEKPIEDDAFAGSLAGTFFWGIEAEKMQPGLEYRVELWEAE